MIFIRVDLPAPFSPTRPWISPARSTKSTSRRAATPPKDFEMPLIASRAGVSPDAAEDASDIAAIWPSDQEVILHPQHAGRIVLGHHRTVGDDVLGNAGPRLLAAGDGGHAGNDRAAMDAARRIADRRVHAAILDGIDRRRHGVDAADQDVGAVVRLHHVVGGERHVVVVEERGVDLRILSEIGLPQARDLGDVPVGRLAVEHLDAGILLHHPVEAACAALRPGVAERALGHDHLALAASLVTSACVTAEPMNSLSGARKACTLIFSSGAISVSMSITGMPASIIFCTGWVSVPMPNAWIATKSHFCDAMLSIAARCLTASSWPSNQVTSTL